MGGVCACWQSHGPNSCRVSRYPGKNPEYDVSVTVPVGQGGDGEGGYMRRGCVIVVYGPHLLVPVRTALSTKPPPCEPVLPLCLWWSVVRGG